MGNEFFIAIAVCLLLGFLLGKLQVKYLESGKATKINFRLISAAAFACYAIGVILIVSYFADKI